jgi:hypothetical protein
VHSTDLVKGSEEPVGQCAADGMEQLASDGDDRLQLGLVTTQECFVERLQVGIETNGNQGGHVERATQIPIASPTHAGGLVHRGSRDLMYRVQATVRHPLPH